MFYYFHREREKWSLARVSKTCTRSCQFFKRNLNPCCSDSRIYSLNHRFPSCLGYFFKEKREHSDHFHFEWTCFHLYSGLTHSLSSCDFGVESPSTWSSPSFRNSWPVESFFRFHSFYTTLSSSSSLKSLCLSLGGGVGWAECSASIRFSLKGQLSTEFTQ